MLDTARKRPLSLLKEEEGWSRLLTTTEGQDRLALPGRPANSHTLGLALQYISANTYLKPDGTPDLHSATQQHSLQIEAAIRLHGRLAHLHNGDGP